MQITKAMELVSSSKLRKAKERAERARPFFNILYETISELSAEMPGQRQHLHGGGFNEKASVYRHCG